MTAQFVSGGGLVLLIVIGILYGTQPDREETKTAARVDGLRLVPRQDLPRRNSGDR